MADRLDQELDKLCAGINCMYNMYLAYLDKWTKPMEDLSCFMWMTLSH
jgi:hypothetical protein